jgi:hypothetical protein
MRDLQCSMAAASDCGSAAGCSPVKEGTVVVGEYTGICKELLPLLTSTHGKTFPTIPAILSGTQIKREMGGVRALAVSSLPLGHWGRESH